MKHHLLPSMTGVTGTSFNDLTIVSVVALYFLKCGASRCVVGVGILVNLEHRDARGIVLVRYRIENENSGLDAYRRFDLFPDRRRVGVELRRVDLEFGKLDVPCRRLLGGGGAKRIAKSDAPSRSKCFNPMLPPNASPRCNPAFSVCSRGSLSARDGQTHNELPPPPRWGATARARILVRSLESKMAGHRRTCARLRSLPTICLR
jgi:hypothetical protein